MLRTRIRYLRLRKGWTQDTLAAQAALGRYTVVRAESGKLPRPNTLSRLADALGIAIADLFTDDPNLADGVFKARTTAA